MGAVLPPPPLLSRGGGNWDASAGGVAIFVHVGVPARMPRVQGKESSLASILWGSGRWMHLSVGTSAGKGMLEVMPLYGMQGRGQRNTALLETALHYSAQVGNLPKVVLGDFNEDLDRVQGLPHLMKTALLGGALVDVDKLYADHRGGTCCCAYHSAAGGQTRIDGLLSDKTTASTVVSVAKVEGLHLPGHDPILFVFDLGSTKQSGRCAGWTGRSSRASPQGR